MSTIKWMGKQMRQAAEKQKSYRPDVGSGKMQPVVSYATAGKPRTTRHLKQNTSKPEG